MAELEAEGATPSIVKDHPFEPMNPEWPWDLCGFEYGHRWGEYAKVQCRLSEAAHEETTVAR